MYDQQSRRDFVSRLFLASLIGQDVEKVNVLIDWIIISDGSVITFTASPSSSFISYIFNCIFPRGLSVNIYFH